MITLRIILFSSLAGIPIILGGLLSAFFQTRKSKLKSEINHWLIAFGGGALLSAITFALIPHGIKVLSVVQLSVCFVIGTLSFMGLDMMINRMGSSLAQVVSMMMDFLPEALALGASFAYDHKFGLMLAIFIGLQNFPEGYNSYLELSRKLTKSKTLWLMLLLSFSGIFAALLGEYFLSSNPKLVAVILIYAGGGILYLIFQDIAPLSKRKNDWIPATGASIGFLIGLIGEKFLN